MLNSLGPESKFNKIPDFQAYFRPRMYLHNRISVRVTFPVFVTVDVKLNFIIRSLAIFHRCLDHFRTIPMFWLLQSSASAPVLTDQLYR